MTSRDLHEKPFDESTLVKLKIFEEYAVAWIPTFVMQAKPIAIFDFFAGPGYDSNNVEGSPIRILKTISGQINNILSKNVKVKVYFNEYKSHKLDALRKTCTEYLENNPGLKNVVDVFFYNMDFSEAFWELLPRIKEQPSLVYLDQNGVKACPKVPELEKIKNVDFLLFISSAHVRRFCDRKEFREYLDIEPEKLKTAPANDIHRIIIAELKSCLPQKTQLRLYPFSLKKGPNIYGIVFGAAHPRAFDKFLNIAWNENKMNGEANFDIDDDLQKAQNDLFSEPKLTKLERFKQYVGDKVLSKLINNNFDLYNYCLDEGHLGSHATDCLRKLKKDGKIYFEGASPLVNYEHVYKKKKKIYYEVLK